MFRSGEAVDTTTLESTEDKSPAGEPSIRNSGDYSTAQHQSLVAADSVAEATAIETAADATTNTVTYPEGGTRAWLVVAGSFTAMFCTFGYISSFGSAFALCFLYSTIPGYSFSPLPQPAVAQPS